MSDEEIKREVTDLLSKLIRIDTTNPPGNETAAAELLYDYLSSEGYEPEILEHVDGRGNLLASLKGDGKTRFMLLSHLDVVPADP
ncbi:MAG: peptidase M20, partial [Thermoproteota archaeon]